MERTDNYTETERGIRTIARDLKTVALKLDDGPTKQQLERDAETLATIASNLQVVYRKLNYDVPVDAANAVLYAVYGVFSDDEYAPEG